MSEAGAHGSQPFVLLTCRPAEADFRLPLAQKMQVLGHSTIYIHLMRHPVVPQARAVADHFVVLEKVDKTLDHACRVRSAGPLRTWAAFACRLETILWPQPSLIVGQLQTTSTALPVNAQ